MRLKRYRNTWNKNFRPYIPKKHSIAKIYGEATGKETVVLIVDDRFSYMIKNWRKTAFGREYMRIL